jgi:hypothetical protein
VRGLEVAGLYLLILRAAESAVGKGTVIRRTLFFLWGAAQYLQQSLFNMLTIRSVLAP